MNANIWLSAVLVCSAASAETRSYSACSVLLPKDSTRIQTSLNLCAPGQAVVLRGGRFESGPLIVPRRVTLFVDSGATLLASKNVRDFDIKPGSCGKPPEGKQPACKPFVYSYQAAYSGVAGRGVIDGQGTPAELVSSYESTGFRVEGVTLRNGGGIHAAIYKTIGLEMSDVRVDSAAGSGVLLSNAVDPVVNGLRAHVPGPGLSLRNSVLGPTTGVKLRGVSGSIDRGDVRDVKVDEDAVEPVEFKVDLGTVAKPGTQRAIVVAPGESVQKAVDALPVSGGEITVKPGTYREVVTIRKPHVHLHGSDPDPAKTVIVFDNVAGKSGGTFNTATVFVEADDVTIDHLSIVNDVGSGKGQGVALHAIGDRGTFRNLRISGAQDTLFSASRYCYGDYGPCPVARHYFADSFIEGNTDFIFGDSKAVFENCELHGVPTGQVMYTAQSRHTPEQDSGYIFVNCRLTGAPRNGVISLGRSWRPYATVVFLHADVEAPVVAEGWTEWPRFGVPTLPTAYYAEFESTGPGANPKGREKWSHQLTAAEAAKWSPREYLKGTDGWNPISGGRG
jgi:pectinesterase